MTFQSMGSTEYFDMRALLRYLNNNLCSHYSVQRKNKTKKKGKHRKRSDRNYINLLCVQVLNQCAKVLQNARVGCCLFTSKKWNAGDVKQRKQRSQHNRPYP